MLRLSGDCTQLKFTGDRRNNSKHYVCLFEFWAKYAVSPLSLSSVHT